MKFGRIKSKLGFSLIELIVVLVIIGVISAIAVPILVTRSGAIDRGWGYSKSFYYDIQDLLAEYSFYDQISVREIDDINVFQGLNDLKGGAAPPDNWSALLMVQYTDDMVQADEIIVKMYVATGIAGETDDDLIDKLKDPASVATCEGFDLDNNPATYGEDEDIRKHIRNRCAPVDGTDGGWLFAIIDSRFRVVRTFWSTASYVELQADSPEFSFTDKDNYIDENVVAGFPIGVDEKDKTMFAPYVPTSD